MPLSVQQADRLAHLRNLDDGWCGFGLGDAPTVLALTAAEDLLAALPEREQDHWRIDAEPDGGLRFEREDLGASDALIFVDVARSGATSVVWFDSRNREHQRRYPQAADCARALLDLLGAFPVTYAPVAVPA